MLQMFFMKPGHFHEYQISCINDPFTNEYILINKDQ